MPIPRRAAKTPRWALCLCALAFLAGCAGSPGAASGTQQPAAEAAASQTSAGQQGASAPAQGTRSNTSKLYEPKAPGNVVLGAEPLLVDVSNVRQGYVMARYSGSAAKANIQITGPDGVTYKYFLPPSADWVPLPLTGGEGPYAVDGYENIADTRYAVLFKEGLDVTLENELLPYLYPNQFVMFNAATNAVEVAAQAVEGAADDLGAVEAIYHYVIEHVTYDEEKAATVSSGYLPVVDETLASGKGICFDYASLTAAMLRSQGIPTRLEIGYAGQVYHAWISVYTEQTGWIDRIIEFSGAWTRMDPTFAASNGSSEAVLQYIGDGSNYTVQYSR